MVYLRICIASILIHVSVYWFQLEFRLDSWGILRPLC
uniref:Uncharacterized protein n=1 Tax=Arundo donax TaxID=35708 RepID=A0A0A8XV71_ARUDO